MRLTPCQEPSIYARFELVKRSFNPLVVIPAIALFPFGLIFLVMRERDHSVVTITETTRGSSRAAIQGTIWGELNE